MGLVSVQQRISEEADWQSGCLLYLVEPSTHCDEGRSASTPSTGNTEADLHRKQIACRIAAADIRIAKRKKHDSENEDLFRYLSDEAMKLRRAWEHDGRSMPRALIRKTLFKKAREFNLKHRYRWTAEKEQRTAISVFEFCFGKYWVNRGVMRPLIDGLSLSEKQRAAAVRTAEVKRSLSIEKVMGAIRQFDAEGYRWTQYSLAWTTGLSRATVQRVLEIIRPKKKHH